MEHYKITCDQCGGDLTVTPNVEDYRIALLNQRIPFCGGAVTMMNIKPHLVSDRHFCGVACLREFMTKL